MLDVFVADGQPPEYQLWLASHPPWRQELLHPCVSEFTGVGDVLLDPFARHASLLRTAQATDRRVLATNFDPLPLLQLRLSLSPPEPRTLDAVFSRLADTPRQGRPLSHYLSDLYLVHCPRCAHPLSAEYIIWEEDQPVEKGFDCHHCEARGTAPITTQDLDIQASADPQDVTYWRLHQRLADPDDSSALRKRVESLLGLYTVRNRTALGQLILQAEVLFMDDEPSLDIIRGLCLACLQRCHSLHRTSDRADLPRSLYQPHRFVERNVWKTFETAYRNLRQRPQTTPITWAADLATLLELAPNPTSGQALIWQRTTQQLFAALRDRYHFPLVCTDPPRADPTTYALAFLWTGWLFGREATLPLRSLARRVILDWEWYTEAMIGVLRLLHSLLTDGGRLLLAFSTDKDQLLPALLLAAARSGLSLEHSVHQHQGDPAPGGSTTYRLVFRRPHRPVHPLPSHPDSVRDPLQILSQDLQEEGAAAARIALEVRAEPVPASWLHLPICVRWSKEELLRAVPERDEEFRPHAWLMNHLGAVLPGEETPPGELVRLDHLAGAEKGQSQAACWWLAKPPVQEPLSERVEITTLALLQETLTWPQVALHDELCRRFRGLATPDAAMLEASIRSYGQEVSPGYWQLRAEDWPQARAKARRQTLQLLVQLGRFLEYDVWLAPEERLSLGPDWGDLPPRGAAPADADLQDWAACALIWHEGGVPAHGFALSDTAALSRWLQPPPPALVEVPRYIIVPGSRAGLLAWKLRCWPQFGRRLADHGWMIVKQRHLRSLGDMEDLDRAGWHTRIGMDAIADAADEQLALF